jgi:uncharacterized protein YyaL (SSP411 family)
MTEPHPDARPANRLARETSPYLLQHAHNPVDWYPWGDEALRRAREEDLPILLSVGYSACHWCHVMERESFENEEVARLMNGSFVNVKVDREERPDVDALYMTAVQQMTGRGGWPMTVFLMPDGTPFYGGTYFPPTPRHGLPAFSQILVAVADAYRERRDEVARSADELRLMLRQSMELRPPPSPLGLDLLDAAYRGVASNFDPRHGGFGGAPKFPQPMVLDFLLRSWRRTGDEEALRMVVETLRAMARGGIYDQLGGGFHRYSVDARWLVPHFEKMLYDNALLARIYLHAWQATGDVQLRRVAEEVLDYAVREMISPEGGFYSAQDADSEGEEGRFYVWTPAEIDAALGPEDGPLFRRYFDVTDAGNFEGKNILHADRPAAEVAAELGVPLPRLEAAVARGRETLYPLRSRRVWPGRDEKVLTAWNAMMLRSFAEAAAALGRADYLEVARRCAAFLLGPLRPEGRLLRSYRDGSARIDAFLEDHALLVDALVSLYQADFDPRWIAEARSLAGVMVERFWSEEDGMFFDTARDGERLVVRPRDINDSATPSGASAAATALLRLAALTGDESYERLAVREMENLSGLLERLPQGFGAMLSAIDRHLAPAREVAVVGRPDAEDTLALLRVVRGRYLPNAVLALRDPALPEDAVRDLPLLADRPMVEGRAAAYVCEHFACHRPVTTTSELDAELSQGLPRQ